LLDDVEKKLIQKMSLPDRDWNIYKMLFSKNKLPETDKINEKIQPKSF